MSAKEHHEAQWTFLSNHAHVLLCIAQSADIRLRDLADKVGITERAVHRIVTDLLEAGYIDVIREGRCNLYRVHPEKHLRHPIEAHCRVSDLIGMIESSGNQEPEPKT
ncbi:MAG: ArsR family transcriptional regulator [Lentisphaerae bacterium]|nr:MAG: ArsR family transcriptional regulator [Lentisphaerota bacterium]